MKVQRISPEVRDIHVPLPLRNLPLWCVWAFEQHEDEPKPRKVPQYSAGGRRFGIQGSPADRAKLTTFAVARDAAAKRGLDGVGFTLMADTGVIALDFDKCVVDGKVDRSVLDLVVGTYAEYSPSGTGVRAFFFGASDVLGNPKSIATAEQFGVEVFSSTGFVTVTGNMLDHVDLINGRDHIEPLPASVIAFCAKRFTSSAPAVLQDDFTVGREPRLNLTVERMTELVNALDPDMGRDDWIRVGMALHHESGADDTGFDIWDDWSAGGGTYPSTEALRAQWDSFTRRQAPGRPQVTMASVIKMAKDAGRVSPTTTPEQILAVADQIIADRPAKSVGRFGPVPIFDLSQLAPGEWLVKGVMPAGQLYSIYGASGSGKTFVALDLAFSIAMGRSWRGNRVKRGRVVIIAAEGGTGIGKRGEAYARHHGIDLRDADVHVITAAPNFLEEMDVAEVIAEIKALGDVVAVFVDTVAQVSPGANENTSEDMGRVLASMRLIAEAINALVVAVHHAGKDLSKGARGWSGFRAAMDGQMEVTRHENGSRELRLDKMKDGEDGLRWGFKLEVIEVGFDADGDTITSCVAVEADLPQAAVTGDRKEVVRYGNTERHVLEMIELHHRTASDVALGTLTDQCVAALAVPEAGKRDIRRQSVQRAITSLAKRKEAPISIERGRVIICM